MCIIKNFKDCFMIDSLIANSGIQYSSADLSIDLNDGFKVLFHEWFDNDTIEQNLEFAYSLPNQTVYSWSELQRKGHIDERGNLLTSVNQILADPNLLPLGNGATVGNSNMFYYMKFSDKNCKLESFYNQWIPIPFLELDAHYNTRPGPYNWCRLKIIPKNISNTKIEAQLLFAFDTRALYTNADEFAECPYFESSTILKKEYRFCDRKSLLVDFCKSGDRWVQSFLMSLVYGYTDMNKIQPDNRGNIYYFLATYMALVEYISMYVELPVITLHRDRDVAKNNVEMIIDIGNSRTAAILYENDFTKVEMLRLQNFRDPLLNDGSLNRTEESFDMSLAFEKVDYGMKSHRRSCQFIWPSMVRLGVEANYLTHQTIGLSDGDEIYSTYSSPKRYLWDTKIRREEWRCVRKDKVGKNKPLYIEGISVYFDDDGTLEPSGQGFGSHYSRRTLMTFAFMEILAQAQVQINSYDYRVKLGKKETPRGLDKIILTCPTGMSKNEQMALHSCLKDALFVLNKFYTNNDKTYKAPNISIVPELNAKYDENGDLVKQWIFDEATCSHFVYLYGLFTHTYQNCSDEFFRMYGKRRADDNGRDVDSIRIGSLDIGAGTTDIMICQYNYNDSMPSQLRPIPVFWDSFSTAGDDMLYKLISNYILQGKDGLLECELLNRGWDKERYRRTLYNLVGGNHREKSFVDKIIRRDFNLQVLIPLMQRFLELHCQEKKVGKLSYSDVFGKVPPSDEVLVAFKSHFGFDLSEMVWEYDYDILSLYIERSMDELLSKVAAIMYSYDCDIILLSGRPTSLRPIKDTFLKYFPVAPNRMIVLNKHRIGTWYSYVDEFGRINNSKSIVPLGAMIGYLASSAGGINNFSLDLTELGKRLTPTTEYFVVNDSKANANKSFITPDKQSGIIRENSFPIYIGSKQYDISLYPIRPFYVLDFNEDVILRRIELSHKKENLTASLKQEYFKEYKDKILKRCPLTFTIERENYKEQKEILSISGIENNNKDTIVSDDFLLSIQSLNDPECYWLDSGAFEINITA